MVAIACGGSEGAQQPDPHVHVRGAQLARSLFTLVSMLEISCRSAYSYFGRSHDETLFEENTACDPPSAAVATARAWRRAPPRPCMRAHSSHPPPTRPLARRCGWCRPRVCRRVPKPSARRDPHRAEPTCLGARWQVRGCKRSIRSARHGRDSQDRCLVRPPHLMWEPSFGCS